MNKERNLNNMKLSHSFSELSHSFSSVANHFKTDIPREGGIRGGGASVCEPGTHFFLLLPFFFQ